MSKFGKYIRQVPPKERPWDIHPIWRGIGCLLLLIGPFIAFAAAHLLVSINLEEKWVAVPREMSLPYTIPEIYTIDHFYADLLVAFVLLILGIGLIMVLYAALYGLLGPSRYGPLDSPYERHQPKRNRR